MEKSPEEPLQQPRRITFSTSPESFCLCSEVTKYLSIPNVQQRYPGLFRRKASPEEKAALMEQKIPLRVTPLLLKANEVDDLIEGRVEKYTKEYMHRKRLVTTPKESSVKRMCPLPKGTLESKPVEQSSSKLAKGGKPPYTYLMLTGQAFLMSKSGILTASEIFQYIRDTYPYYRSQQSPRNWKTAIYGVLSKKVYFKKVDGQGSIWQVVDEYRNMLRKISFGPITYDNTSVFPSSSTDLDDFIISDNDPIRIIGEGSCSESGFDESNNCVERKFCPPVESEQAVRLSESGAVIIDQCAPVVGFEIKEAIESISKQENRRVPSDEIIDLLSDNEEEEEEEGERVKREMEDASSESVDLTIENYAICPICDEAFASDTELGAHVKSHRKPSLHHLNGGTPTINLDDNVMVKQTLENLPSALFGQDKRAICIFTGNPNLYFKP